MLEKVDWFSFIFGGIIVAFIVNILSSFAQPKIENWLDKYNSKRRDKNKKIKQAFEAEVQRLLTSDHEESVTRQNRTFYLIWACLMNIFFMGFFIVVIVDDRSIVETMGLVCALVTGVFFLLFITRVMKIIELLRAVDIEKGRPNI